MYAKLTGKDLNGEKQGEYVYRVYDDGVEVLYTEGKIKGVPCNAVEILDQIERMGPGEEVEMGDSWTTLPDGYTFHIETKE